jgi:hypothetical protein
VWQLANFNFMSMSSFPLQTGHFKIKPLFLTLEALKTIKNYILKDIIFLKTGKEVAIDLWVVWR